MEEDEENEENNNNQENENIFLQSKYEDPNE